MAQQLTINLEQSLTDQYSSFMDAVRASVYNCGKPVKSVAADLDMSVSELSRRLSPSDPLPLSGDDFEKILKSTGNLTPVYWLVEKFLEGEDEKRKRAVDALSKLMPQIQSLLNQVSR